MANYDDYSASKIGEAGYNGIKNFSSPYPKSRSNIINTDKANQQLRKENVLNEALRSFDFIIRFYFDKKTNITVEEKMDIYDFIKDELRQVDRSPLSVYGKKIEYGFVFTEDEKPMYGRNKSVFWIYFMNVGNGNSIPPELEKIAKGHGTLKSLLNSALPSDDALGVTLLNTNMPLYWISFVFVDKTLDKLWERKWLKQNACHELGHALLSMDADDHKENTIMASQLPSSFGHHFTPYQSILIREKLKERIEKLYK